MRLKIGCCGFGRARAQYFARFPLVEVQRTFYSPPRLTTAQRWRAEAPPQFEFTLKAWQLITHEPSSPTYGKARLQLDAPPDHYGAFRLTAQVLRAWNSTCEIAGTLDGKAVLLQCPPSFSPTEQNIHNLNKFLSTVDRGKLQLASEPRGVWPADLVRTLCEDHQLIHAVGPFKNPPVTSGSAYFRLHGRQGYPYRYTDEDLHQLLTFCGPFEEVYCLFNNISMWDDATRLSRLVAEPNR